MNNCIFCQRRKIAEDILYESDNFFVKVGIGIIAAGHVMIISKRHLACFAEMPVSLVSEYQELKSWLVEKITAQAAKPVQIEYGIWGQTVFHAHTHFIPKQGPGYRVKSLVEEMFKSAEVKLDLERADWDRLREIYRTEKCYVSVEEDGVLYVCHVCDIKEDSELPYLNYRAFMARRFGLRGVKDWRQMSKSERLVDEHKRNLTKAMFAKAASELTGLRRPLSLLPMPRPSMGS